MAQIKKITVSLTEDITLAEGYQFAWVKNTGSETLYISGDHSVLNAEGQIFDKDVATIKAGEATMVTIPHGILYCYSESSTTAEVHAQGIPTCPFKIRAKGGEQITVESLTVIDNGTYTAPSGKAYSPVVVDNPYTFSLADEGKVIKDQKPTAQTAITICGSGTYDTTTNNTITVVDYIPSNEYIPNSDASKVICEAYYGNFDASKMSWGNGATPLFYMLSANKPTANGQTNEIDCDAYTHSVIPYIDLGAHNTSFTAYFVGRISYRYTSGSRLISCMYSRSAGNGVVIYEANSVLEISKWGDAIPTTIPWDAEVVIAIKNTNTSSTTNATKVFIYAGDSIITATEEPTNIGQYITIARTDIRLDEQFASPSKVSMKYLAVVNEAETDAVIEANIANLYSEFIGA